LITATDSEVKDGLSREDLIGLSLPPHVHESVCCQLLCASHRQVDFAPSIHATGY